MSARSPCALLLGVAVSAPDGALDGAGPLLSAAHSAGVPVIVVAAADGFSARVDMARQGVRGYLPRPAPPKHVVDTLERVLDRVNIADMTVLAVDDDESVLAAVSALLADQGVTVRTLSDPLRFWDTLEQTAPDLIVLDVDMPGASGYDLCRVVRADPRWSQLPVLFLTGSVDGSTTHDLFAAGADDYVAKPVVGRELVMRITNRLERLRLYRRLAETDPLTGIANRRKATDELKQLLRLATRYKAPLSVALLDLDHFKAVNDTHGHVTGDLVLRELAVLLRREFRGEDVVARWGGEEFLVGMYGMADTDAVPRITALLTAFQRRAFPAAGNGSFHASFSAGVAQLRTEEDDLGLLYQQADTALYAAKAAGRARVIAAGSEAQAVSTAYVDVVLVEDDEALAPLLLHALEARNLSTAWLREGDLAAQQLTGPVPALRGRVVLLDWDLPGLNGAALLSELARNGTLATTRVIMLTGRSREEEVLRVLELGAADHVAKPFSLPVLLQRIRHQLGPDAPR